MSKPILFTMAVIIAGIVGCVGDKEAKYVNPNKIITGKADSPTMYDLESSARLLMERMLAHPQFVSNYNAAKAAKGRLPIAVIGNIENKTNQRVQGRLDAVGETIREVLFDSSLFEVKDDEAANAIKSRIIRSADGGLENGALVQAMGTQDSPDFILLGDLRHYSEQGGYNIFRLRLAIHDLRTGKIIWEGIQTKIKL